MFEQFVELAHFALADGAGKYHGGVEGEAAASKAEIYHFVNQHFVVFKADFACVGEDAALGALVAAVGLLLIMAGIAPDVKEGVVLGVGGYADAQFGVAALGIFGVEP